jgi:hypothetical protein
MHLPSRRIEKLNGRCLRANSPVPACEDQRRASNRHDAQEQCRNAEADPSNSGHVLRLLRLNAINFRPHYPTNRSSMFNSITNPQPPNAISLDPYLARSMKTNVTTLQRWETARSVARR